MISGVYYQCRFCGLISDDGDVMNKVCPTCLDDDVYKLVIAQNHAEKYSECAKVKVGALIVKGPFVILGANRTIPSGCDGVSCNRVLPQDGLPHCVSTLHAEIDAIVRAKADLKGATAFVTRYPCENCARALVTAGIKKVIYGRWPKISKDAQSIFTAYGVEVVHKPFFNPEED